MPSRVAQVLVESPIPRLDRLFDYAIPAELDDLIVQGCRVRVPFGKGGGRKIPAFVVNIVDESHAGVDLAPIDAMLGTMPVLTPALWSLARQLADRNCGNAIDVLKVAIPKRTVRTEKVLSIAPRPQVRSREGSRQYLALSTGMTSTPAGTTRRGFVEIAERVRTATGGVIVVAPDWRDVALISRALHDIPHAVVDSTGTPSERYARYLGILSGETRVIVGTRSAVYAPVKDLELLVVVDESDPLLEEQIAPYIHARDAAVLRHSIEGGDLLFASVTPSVESRRYEQLGFVERIPHTPTRPHIVLANDATDDEFAGRARIPSSAWRRVRDAAEQGPILVQVARPGFMPQVVCTQCRTAHRCEGCRSLLTGNREGTVLCRVCGQTPIGLKCRLCGGREVAWSGAGSVRTAEELGRAFPGLAIIVADGEHRTLEIPRRASLVVATRGAEPVVEGGYAAVLIVDGEKELQQPGLRTTENCLRWWGHAASLASDDGVVVLTNVEGTIGSNFAANTWESIVDTELRERQALGFPPASRSIAVRGTIGDLQRVRELAPLAGHRILGPVLEGDTHRMVVLADYRSAPDVVAAIRTLILGSSASSLRVHCDDVHVFDDVDND